MDKISDRIKKKQPVFSFEFFPPKSEDGERQLMSTIEELRALEPDFVSVTWGAGGSTREKTREWARSIQDRFGIVAMAHLTCVGAGREEIRGILRDLYSDGIRNIMALRGDPPAGEKHFVPPAEGFAHANELIRFIRSSHPDFCIGGAAYPEKHIEAATLDEDLGNIVKKVQAGADFLVTQMFFDNSRFFAFVERAHSLGVQVPVIPGIMPITSFKQIERFTQMAGCSIPVELREKLEAVRENSEELVRVSLDFTLNQCRDLLLHGVPGIHFYTLNQSRATAAILEQLRSFLPEKK